MKRQRIELTVMVGVLVLLVAAFAWILMGNDILVTQ